MGPQPVESRLANPYKFSPVVCIVGFHHARGPEVEQWFGVDHPNVIPDWPLLPFMALSDGAHSSSEDFSYFTLKYKYVLPEGGERPTSLFGISCTRQLDSSTLIDRPADVTRSTVQKAVVVIADSPVYFGQLKEKLSMVTKAWFAQRNFEDLDIIRKFQESLKYSMRDDVDEREQYLGLSLRELVYEFRHQTLVLFKCTLLQPKMLFFGSRCERLCMTQFSLVSLVPDLLRNLQDCADPDMNNYESTLVKPTSVKTSDRKSLLTFMGLPLQIFGKGSLFGPYTPLQQLDILADVGTKSYVVGSTNSLLLQQKDRYSDILINLDDGTINITSSSLRTALYLTAADRRWIDSVVHAVTESWDEADPSRPKTMGFVGSEDYIRLQFEEYILSMVSAVKYHDFLEKHAGAGSRMFLPDVDGDPAEDFGIDFIDMWKRTENYRIFQKFTDSELFDLVPPKHVMAGGITMEDVSRRISQQISELKLDEKVAGGKEAVAKTLATGRGKVTAAFSALSKNVETLRENQRKKSEQEPKSPSSSIASSNENQGHNAEKSAQAPASTSEATPRTGYFASWAAWAGEKRRKAFGGSAAATPTSSPTLNAATSSASVDETLALEPPSVPPSSSPQKRLMDEDVYDPETGIGKGDSGVISPAIRASIDGAATKLASIGAVFKKHGFSRESISSFTSIRQSRDMSEDDGITTRRSSRAEMESEDSPNALQVYMESLQKLAESTFAKAPTANSLPPVAEDPSSLELEPAKDRAPTVNSVLSSKSDQQEITLGDANAWPTTRTPITALDETPFDFGFKNVENGGTQDHPAVETELDSIATMSPMVEELCVQPVPALAPAAVQETEMALGPVTDPVGQLDLPTSPLQPKEGEEARPVPGEAKLPETPVAPENSIRLERIEGDKVKSNESTRPPSPIKQTSVLALAREREAQARISRAQTLQGARRMPPLADTTAGRAAHSPSSPLSGKISHSPSSSLSGRISPVKSDAPGSTSASARKGNATLQLETALPFKSPITTTTPRPRSPTKNVLSPSRENPTKGVKSPVKDARNLTKDIKSPVKEVTSPVKDITSPVKDITSPIKDITSPIKTTGLGLPALRSVSPTKNPPPPSSPPLAGGTSLASPASPPPGIRRIGTMPTPRGNSLKDNPFLKNDTGNAMGRKRVGTNSTLAKNPFIRNDLKKDTKEEGDDGGR